LTSKYLRSNLKNDPAVAIYNKKSSPQSEEFFVPSSGFSPRTNFQEIIFEAKIIFCANLQRSSNFFPEKPLILFYALLPHQPAAGLKNRKIFHSLSFLRAGGIFEKLKGKFCGFGLRWKAKAEAAR